MVAVLLRLRFRVLVNTLQRNTFQLVAVIIGGPLGAALVMVALAGMLLASTLPPTATQAVVVVGGSALVFGWLLVPLLFDGVDRTLDPLKLARFPLRTGTLMAGMFVAGISWLPGIATVVVSVGTAIAWRAHPPAAVSAVIAGLIGAATCVAGSRLTTSVAASLLRGRGALRAGIAALVVLALLLVLAVPLYIAVVSRGALGDRDTLEGFSAALDVLGWSPFGAVWSVPGRIAAGDLAGAAAAAVIALATLCGALLLWRMVLSAALRVRGERPLRPVAGGRLGALGWVPTTPTGAVLARSLIYWFRDARQARQLILLPVLPALMLLWWSLFGIELIALSIGPIVATILPLSAFAGLSYDGTAFAAELSAGIRGLHDRVGRALALLIIAMPAVIVVQTAVALIVGRGADLPALLGLSLAAVLISVGVVSVSSARFVIPVARSGRNPFSAQAGAATTSVFASYGVAVVTVLLALPILALTTAAIVAGVPALGWLALVAGLVLGAGVAFTGVVLGGRVLDASGPAMLARLRLART
jgi:ABC-2 type transport system permease protein